MTFVYIYIYDSCIYIYDIRSCFPVINAWYFKTDDNNQAQSFGYCIPHHPNIFKMWLKVESMYYIYI